MKNFHGTVKVSFAK